MVRTAGGRGRPAEGYQAQSRSLDVITKVWCRDDRDIVALLLQVGADAQHR